MTRTALAADDREELFIARWRIADALRKMLAK